MMTMARPLSEILSNVNGRDIQPAPKERPHGYVGGRLAGSPFVKLVVAVFKQLWPSHSWNIRLRVLLCISFVIVTKVTKVAVPVLFKCVVDNLTAHNSASSALVYGPVTLSLFAVVLAYGIVRLVSVGTFEAKSAVFASVSATAANSIAMQLFTKLHRMDISFHQNKHLGQLSRELDRGSRAFAQVVYVTMFMIVPVSFEVVLVCFMLQKAAGLAFVGTAVGAVGVYIVWTLVLTNRRIEQRDQFNAADNHVQGLIIESLVNWETIKYFGAEELEYGKVREATYNMNCLHATLDRSLSLLSFGQQGVFSIAATFSLYLSVTAVASGTMTVGMLVLVDSLLMQLYFPLHFLGTIYRELTTSVQNMQKTMALLESEERFSSPKDAVPFKFKGGEIAFDGVSYQCPDGTPVFDHLSLRIAGGSYVGIVGPSGSGKSTLFHLLFRFYDPQAGRIFVDGQDISEVQLPSLRKYIGVVPQDTVLFNDTIMYNIRYGKPDATEDEVIRAARRAHIHDAIVEFPDGYQSLVGERGSKLSGGEKQRIAIARVLLKDSPIILADEATSALDTSMEAKVMRTLKEESAGGKRTIVMIAHRLSMVKDADCIFVLSKNGSLAEHGTHEELLSKGGLYCSMWKQQLASLL